jgi:hypothetical protein
VTFPFIAPASADLGGVLAHPPIMAAPANAIHGVIFLICIIFRFLDG